MKTRLSTGRPDTFSDLFNLNMFSYYYYANIILNYIAFITNDARVYTKYFYSSTIFILNVMCHRKKNIKHQINCKKRQNEQDQYVVRYIFDIWHMSSTKTLFLFQM